MLQFSSQFNNEICDAVVDELCKPMSFANVMLGRWCLANTGLPPHDRQMGSCLPADRLRPVGEGPNNGNSCKNFWGAMRTRLLACEKGLRAATVKPLVQYGSISALEDGDNAITTDGKSNLLLYRLRLGVGISGRFLEMEG